MFQPLSPARLSRTLVAASALSLCAVAHAAVPASTSASASPFGVDATGHFEPTAPLAGAGWQLLAANAKRVKAATAAPATVIATPATDIAAASVSSTPASIAAPPAAPMPATTAALPTAPSTWVVSPVDGNFRQLVETWASRAGWSAAPWELERDVPIVGSDVFDGDFKAAVRRVLSSTEMTDYIIKPCFYSNNVVRVVKLTTKCDLSQ
ncbi:toxin co-regulated pilus biosynthesis Q family protein [Cupriavidus sp. BIC8F]|uniref:toxin co-regulated pilus biosynthesis Q family protein n=1 Tax=Cupriavidus sp. BIC8F TaxID=3079014 RepID=UPI002916417D|nr:toxin co-regulated pilus biosynthesis Q family protein [Cupriavidus sp. BIC8F]